MKLTILGCGTSSGVPRIGGDWGACDPAEPRNRRTRVSALIESDTTRILIDTGPDLRAQLLDAGVGRVDAIIWTHDHADHCHGIDDVRQLFHARGSRVPGYARAETLGILQARFGYAFDGRDGYRPILAPQVLHDEQMIGDIRVRVVDQPHGPITSAGLRFDGNGHAIGYATDFNVFSEDMLRLYEGIDIWVVDALRERPHPSHPSLGEALDHVARVRPGLAILTHMDQSMDYATLMTRLPDRVVPGHDGMVVTL